MGFSRRDGEGVGKVLDLKRFLTSGISPVAELTVLITEIGIAEKAPVAAPGPDGTVGLDGKRKIPALRNRNDIGDACNPGDIGVVGGQSAAAPCPDRAIGFKGEGMVV